MGHGRPQSFAFDLGVFAVELGAVDLLTGEEGRLARILDLHLLQHLTNDDLDVLVVDAHTLQPVDLLDLVDQVAGQLLDPENAQDVVRHAVAVHHQVALQDVIAFLHADVLALRDQVLDRLGGAAIGRHHDDAPLGLVVLAEFDATLAFADDREILRLARLEQLGHPRQTAGDVARLRGFTRDPGEDVAGFDLRAVIDRQDRVDRQEVARLQAIGEGQHLALRVAQGDAGAQVAAARLLLPVDDDLRGNAGRFVEHLAHRDAFGEIDIVRDAILFGDDRDRVGVPFGQTVGALDLAALIGQQPRPVGHAVPRLLAAGVVEQHQLGVAAHHHRQTGRVDHDVAVLDLDLRVERGLERGLLGTALGGAADVEGPHRQLRAGLADRLRGDDPDRFAHIDHGAAGQIASVAFAAYPGGCLAGQHRADRHRVDAGALDRIDRVLIDQLAGGEHDLAVQRVEDIDRRATADDAVGQWRDDLAAIDDGAGQQTAGGAAILLGDDRVLRDVDQPARQIAGIGGLQRGVGEAFARAVRRVEVLEHGQPFLEVRDDRGGDDLARRLGHQPAHPGQLLDLGRGAACPGIRHHPHRVDRLARLRRADDLDHLLGDLFRAAGPGVDFLVVLLALGDQAVLVLLLVLLDLLLHLGDEAVLRLRDD